MEISASVLLFVEKVNLMSKKQSTYILKPSNAFIYTWLVIVLIINIGLYLIFFFYIDPIIQNSSNPSLYSKVFWALFVVISFLFFAIIYILVVRHIYWIDIEVIEIRNSFRPKKKKAIKFNEINNITIRRIPLISNAFNFGTIILRKNEDGKEKIIGKLIGIKYPEEVYYELRSKINLTEEDFKEIMN